MDTSLIVYEPGEPAGQLRPLPGGEAALTASPEDYYCAYLGQVMNATVAFLHALAAADLPPERMAAVDDALAHAYWAEMEGCLTPPPILDVLARAGAGAQGAALLRHLERLKERMFSLSLSAAADEHAKERVGLLSRGAAGELTDYQVAVGELMCDYLLLQRAVAADVKRAEQERREGETRAHAIDRLDKAGDMQFERMLARVLDPDPVLSQVRLQDGAPLAEFSRRRRDYQSQGVLSDLGTA